MIQKEALEKAAREGKGLPVPQANPLERPVEQAAVQAEPARKSLWGLFSRSEPAAAPAAPAAEAPAQQGAGQPAAQQPAPGQPQAAAGGQQAAPPAQDNAQVAAAPAGNAQAPAPEQQPAEQPKKRPFWKLWGN